MWVNDDRTWLLLDSDRALGATNTLTPPVKETEAEFMTSLMMEKKKKKKKKKENMERERPSPSPLPSFTSDNTGESQKKKGSLWSCLLLLLLHHHHHHHQYQYQYHRHYLLLYQTLRKSWSHGFLRSTQRCSIFPQLIRSMRALFLAVFASTQPNLAASSAPFASQLHLL